MNSVLNRNQLLAPGLAAVVTLVSGWQPLVAAPLLNDPVDVSADFQNFANTLFLAVKLATFDHAFKI
jgi:hypothetical protein